MERNKYSIKVRNEIASIAGWCDSAAAINGARLNPVEREAIQERLREIVNYIDSKIKVK